MKSVLPCSEGTSLWILALHLEPRFEQCRKKVKITAWFLVPSPSMSLSIPKLGGKEVHPFCFPLVPAALCPATQYSDLVWVCHALQGARLSNPWLCITANTHPAPGPGNHTHRPKIIDIRRQRDPRTRWLQKLALMLEGEGRQGRMEKQWISTMGCVLAALSHAVRGVHQSVSVLWFWLSFVLNPELRKKVAQRLLSLSDPLCTCHSSGKGLSDPFVGTVGAWLHMGADSLESALWQHDHSSKLQQDPFWLECKTKEHTVARILKIWRRVKDMQTSIPAYSTLASLHSLCLENSQYSWWALTFAWFSLLPARSFITGLNF